jgi:hypothetical protein
MKMRSMFALLLAGACGNSSSGGPATSPAPSPSDTAPAAAAPIPSTSARLPPGPAPQSADPVAALAGLEGLCGSGGWCWRRPTPIGVQLNAIWASSPNDIWIGGDRGTVLHWDGKAWASRPLPIPPPPYEQTAEAVQHIHGLGPNDVWATSGTAMYHWDGSAWSIRFQLVYQEDQRVTDIFAFAPNDVWAGGNYGYAWHWDGAKVTKVATAGMDMNGGPLPFAVWGSSSSDIWFGGMNGLMVHYDGKAFALVDTGAGISSIGGLWGTAKNDVWGSGNDGLIIHYDGMKWTKLDSGTKNALPRVHGSAANDVWFSGYHGTMLHWDGKALVTESGPYDRGLYDVYVGGAGDVWAVGQAAEVDHRDAKSWSRVVGGDYYPQNAIWGADANSVWVVGPGQLLHYDGLSWQQQTSTQKILGLSAIGGTGAKDVWAVGQLGNVHHFDDRGWTGGNVGATGWLNGVWARPGFVVAVGDGGAAYRYDRTAMTWSPVTTGTTQALYGIWGPSDDLAWAVGANGTILRWTSGSFAPDTSPVTNRDLMAVHGSSDGAVWIVGKGGDPTTGVPFNTTALRLVSNAWSPTPVPGLDLTSVFVVSATEAHVASSAGLMSQWDGVSWKPQTFDSPDTIMSVWGPPDGSSLWVGTDSGGLLQRIGP